MLSVWRCSVSPSLPPPAAPVPPRLPQTQVAAERRAVLPVLVSLLCLDAPSTLGCPSPFLGQSDEAETGFEAAEPFPSGSGMFCGETKIGSPSQPKGQEKATSLGARKGPSAGGREASA